MEVRHWVLWTQDGKMCAKQCRTAEEAKLRFESASCACGVKCALFGTSPNEYVNSSRPRSPDVVTNGILFTGRSGDISNLAYARIGDFQSVERL